MTNRTPEPVVEVTRDQIRREAIDSLREIVRFGAPDQTRVNAAQILLELIQ